MVLRWNKIIGAAIAFIAIVSCTSQYSSATDIGNSIADIASQEVGLIFEQSRLTLAEKQARSASVRVVRPLQNGHGSGTYLIMRKRHVVITAAHVVGKFSTMMIESSEDEQVIGRVIYRDDDSDLALILVPKLRTRIPANYLPKKNEQNLIGANITYTGFPGRHELLTIRGHITSLENEMIVSNMFGWFGSSGSGVFDQQGKLLGVVSAIDIGNWYMPIPLNSIVWIAPVWNLDNEIIKVRLATEPPLQIIKSFDGAAAPRRGGMRD